MKQVQSPGMLLLVAALMAGSVANAQQASPDAASIRVAALGPTQAPDEGALRQLVGSATTGSSVQLLNYPQMPVSDRLLAGLEAAGRVLTTADGQTITWGFKHEEANLQSVVIADKAGQLELAAVVDDVVRLNLGGAKADVSVAQYRARVARLGMQPRVVVFARDQARLEKAYPLLVRWLQASLLGFNTSCARHAASCALLREIDLPTEAYLSPGAGELPARTALPKLPVASIPLAKFTQ